MIWCIIGITLFILGAVFCKISMILIDKGYTTIEDVFGFLGVGFVVISLIIIATCSTLIVISHTCGKFEVKEARDQRNAYVMLLKENKDVTVQNQLYKDIIKYNSKLRKNKHYSKSLWTNWFYPDGWDELEYIEIK